jgi:predicted dehydrogenase
MEFKQKRRQFLQTIGTGTVILAAGHFTPAAPGPNDTIQVGCIGTGGRCRQLMSSVKKIPGVRLAAVCDIWDEHLARGREIAHPSAFSTKRFREVLENKDIDAVIVGTPDHWHVPITIAACEAGKDVYVEKPLTHSLEEGASVIKAQNDYKRIVQVGQQQRSMPHLREAHEKYIQPGVLGKVHQIRVFWNRSGYGLSGPPPKFDIDPSTVDWKTFLGNAPDQPFNEQRFRQWRWYWDFGGGILTDLMTHFIDVVHWYMDLEEPESAAALGGTYFNGQGWETPDTINAVFTYPGQRAVVFHGTFANGMHGAGIEFQGQNATLYVDRGRYELYPVDSKDKPESVVIDEKPKGYDATRDEQDLAHLQNWVDSVRSRTQPHCPAEVGVSAAAASHMGNIAFRKSIVCKRL